MVCVGQSEDKGSSISLLGSVSWCVGGNQGQGVEIISLPLCGSQGSNSGPQV